VEEKVAAIKSVALTHITQDQIHHPPIPRNPLGDTFPPTSDIHKILSGAEDNRKKLEQNDLDSLQIQLALNLDFCETIGREDSMKQNIVHDIALAIDGDPNKICVQAMHAGSVVVDVLLQKGCVSDGRRLSEVLLDLQHQLLFPDSILMNGHITRHTIKVCHVATNNPEPYDINTDSSIGGDLTVLSATLSAESVASSPAEKAAELDVLTNSGRSRQPRVLQVKDFQRQRAAERNHQVVKAGNSDGSSRPQEANSLQRSANGLEKRQFSQELADDLAELSDKYSAAIEKSNASNLMTSPSSSIGCEKPLSPEERGFWTEDGGEPVSPEERRWWTVNSNGMLGRIKRFMSSRQFAVKNLRAPISSRQYYNSITSSPMSQTKLPKRTRKYVTSPSESPIKFQDAPQESSSALQQSLERSAFGLSISPSVHSIQKPRELSTQSSINEFVGLSVQAGYYQVNDNVDDSNSDSAQEANSSTMRMSSPRVRSPQVKRL
jgi:hypothetical protein